ncbi:MAG: VWA domain-containing protein [Acidobacteriota bacterium]|nr:VWA domain-containing protein [Acidobacteriota bacterium]
MKRHSSKRASLGRLGAAALLLTAAAFAAAAAIHSATMQATAQNVQTPSAQPQVGYQNQEAQSSYIFHVERNEVLVDVRVTDRKGLPVTDLKAGDFKVYEDGVPQKIDSFSLENIQELATAGGTDGKPAVIDLSTVPSTTSQDTLKKLVQNRRMIVLYFDLSSMQIDDLMRALKSAQTFISAQLTPADLVAVVTYTSDLRVLQQFTNDRDALSKAIKGIEIGPSSSLASNGSAGEAGGTDAVGNAIVTQDTGDAFSPDETEFNIFNTDEKLSALESLAGILARVPGRKSVIYFSSGIEQTGVDNEAQLEATIDAANRGDVSFYTLDARGLMAMPPGGDASNASPSGTAIYTADAVSSQISSMHSSRETLSTLATDTGGRMFHDLNNFAPAFKDVQEINSSYYLIGYSPSNTKDDGRYRRIRVELSGRRGLKVEARPGYYAPKNFKQFNSEDKEVQLQQAMSSEMPFLDLPLAVQTAYFLQPDGHYYVVLAAKVPGSAIPFHGKASSRQTQFDFAWRATDANGKVAGALRDTLPVKLNAAAYQQVLKGNILYEGGIVLPPGAYKLKVVVRENQTGKMGTFEEPLVLPAVAKTAPKLAISSIVVSNEISSTPRSRPQRGPWAMGAENNPLDMGSKSILPSVTRVFRNDQNLYVYLQSYAVKPAGRSRKNSPSPSVALIFFRNGVQISEAGPYPAEKQKPAAPGAASYFTQIPLSKFPPGRYWMQVNVLDPAANQVAFARVPLAIMRATNAAGSGGAANPGRAAGSGL